MRSRPLGILLLMTLGLLLAACGEDPTATPAPTPSATAAPLPTATALPPTPTAGSASARIAPETLRLAPGELAVVTVDLALGQVGLSGADLTLTFDPLGMRVLGVEPGGILGANPVIGLSRVDQEQGEVRIALARVGETKAPTPAGTLATISIQVLQGTGPGTTLALQLTRLTLADEAFQEIQNVQLRDAEISVVAP